MRKGCRFILFAFCLLNTMGTYAQDVIINNNNDTIYCKILEVNNDNIRYRIQKGSTNITNTVNLKYITSYIINDDVQESSRAITDNKTNNEKEPVFRIAIGGGYAKGRGEIKKTGDSKIDKLSNDIVNGYNIEGDIEYYFNLKQKDALNFAAALHFNYIDHHGATTDIDIPDFGHANRYEESQRVFYIAPAFVMRYDLPAWLFTFSAGFGVIFFTNPISIDYGQITGSKTTIGSHTGISAEYKISQNWGIGLRFSVAGGVINSMNIGGVNVKFDQAMSATSWMISGIISFRTK